MANPKHLEILRKGVTAWNRWLATHYDDDPDLSGANLTETNLNSVDFHCTNLCRANLSGANLMSGDLFSANLIGVNLIGTKLIGANLQSAKLTEANLSGVDLSEATLDKADLTQATLDGANLTRAKLSDAYLYGTSLCNADFRKASLGFTMLGKVDLSQVKGLDSVGFTGPCTIGIDTFFLSKGKIPEAFLRGAGVPNIFIEYAASLAGKPIEFYSAFISYSSKDEGLAKRLHADLQAKGVRCWFAPEDLKIGDKFRKEIDHAIRLHDKLLLLLSANSLLSDWVEKEVESAFDRERRDKCMVLFPVRLDDAIMDAAEGWAADIRRTRHIGDFTKWKDHDSYQKAFDRLLRDLKANTKPPTVG